MDKIFQSKFEKKTGIKITYEEIFHIFYPSVFCSIIKNSKIHEKYTKEYSGKLEYKTCFITKEKFIYKEDLPDVDFYDYTIVFYPIKHILNHILNNEERLLTEYKYTFFDFDEYSDLVTIEFIYKNKVKDISKFIKKYGEKKKILF